MHLTDFGIAKTYKKENSKETSGTPGYMAPEVMSSQNHTIAVDYFALGVFGYELMNGVRPYLGKTRKEIKENIMAKQVQIKAEDAPFGWSMESVDFINKLLQRKPINRLGYRGPSEVKEHIWFKNYDWKNLYLMKLKAGFLPKIDDNIDHRYCNAPDKIGINTQERYHNIMNEPKYKETFLEFKYFCREQNEFNENNNIQIEITNPHLIYLKDYEESNEEKNLEIESASVKDFNFPLHNKYNLAHENNETLRKMPISKSSFMLLKGQNKRPLSATSFSEKNFEK